MRRDAHRRQESAARARARSYQATALTIAVVVSVIGGGLVLLGAPPWIIVVLLPVGVGGGLWLQSRRVQRPEEDDPSR